MDKKISKFFAIICCSLTVSLALCFAILAWNEPTQAPPGGNVSAPINVSDGAQIKTGDLAINDKLTVNNAAEAQRFCLPDKCCSTWKECFSDQTPSCVCGYWVNGACGAGDCASVKLQQTRDCYPDGCDAESQCADSSTCSLQPPGDDNNNYCINTADFIVKDCDTCQCPAGYDSSPPGGLWDQIMVYCDVRCEYCCTPSNDVVETCFTTYNNPSQHFCFKAQ